MTTVPVEATLPSLAPAGLKQQAIGHDNVTGGWTADLAGDGPVDITIVCIGGGDLAVNYHNPSRPLGSFKLPCDGTTSKNYDDAAPSGPITVTIKPDGDQRWSARLARGPRS
ncbi:hypothetical protein [Actinoplanes sp. SE50/110]|uniref:hypothetical protein n=1 Tax=Actinoplanes sp. (strain ATCC 31044 / CBS 674.73 / SE50/110) TaxID=134676 RepID=UPI0012BAB671|nr:hypothetical protein [Actinoplanes sp. SE50/110]